MADNRRRLVAGLLVCAVLGACSGGGSSGSGGRTAGIEGTGIVSGFGSVYIDGREFATDGATFIRNGEPSSESQLHVGDVVTVSATVDDNGNATARRISFDNALKGPIDSIETGADGSGVIRVLGQRVRFDPDTHFVDTEAGRLRAGDLIAISGSAGGDGDLHATSVERGGDYQPGATRVEVRGRVRDLDATSFRIGDLTVRYGGARVARDAGALTDGAFVEIAGVRPDGPDAALTADTVTVREQRVGRDGERVFVEGTIERYDSRADFTAAGQRIDAGNARRLDDTGLQPGVGTAVSIRGRRRGNVLIADTFSVEPPPAYTLRARIERVDAAANEVEVLNTDWEVRADTLYIDSRAGRDRALRVGGLAAGDTVSVNGYAAGGKRIMSRLERVPADATGSTRVRGALTTITRRGERATLNVAGVRIVTRAAVTDFRDANDQPIDAATFFDAAGVGRSIDARGPANGSRIDTARVVRLID